MADTVCCGDGNRGMRRSPHVLLGRMVHLADCAARFWLGHPRPGAQEVLARSDWCPDKTDQWCWRCGGSVGPGESAANSGCARCRNRPARRIGDGVVRVGPHVGELREWILATKYQQWHEMGVELGRLLGSQVRRSGLVDRHRAIIVPMPMPWQRRAYRGIDHARVIASAVARDMGATVVPILKRANGLTQTSLEPGQRRANAGRGLSIRWRWGGWPLDRYAAEIVLVDDVTTTGSSLRAAVKLLRELRPVSVITAVVAVSDEQARRARQSGEPVQGDSAASGEWEESI